MAGRSKRGFAAMSPEKQREIASKGGRAAHQKGTAHEFTPEEARIAGRRGGTIVSRNRAHMAAIGRKGGQSPSSGTRPSSGPQVPGEHNGQSGINVRDEQTGQPENETSRSHQEVSPNAIALIKADHRKVNGLFHQYEIAIDNDTQKADVVRQICHELDIHTRLEEEIFYPTVQAKLGGKVKECVNEGIKEHQVIKDLMRQLQGLSPTDASYRSTVQELIKNVTHHVEEEEKSVLPQAEGGLKDELEALGAQMQQRKQHLSYGQAQEQGQQMEERLS